MTYYGWTLHELDVKTAFLQGEAIVREVFLKPPAEAMTKMLGKLRKCVYGLNDAARKFYDKISKFFLKLGMSQCNVGRAFFYIMDTNGVCGAICIHVGDMLYGGYEEFHEQIMKPFRANFVIGREETGETSRCLHGAEKIRVVKIISERIRCQFA